MKDKHLNNINTDNDYIMVDKNVISSEELGDKISEIEKQLLEAKKLQKSVREKELLDSVAMKLDESEEPELLVEQDDIEDITPEELEIIDEQLKEDEDEEISETVIESKPEEEEFTLTPEQIKRQIEVLKKEIKPESLPDPVSSTPLIDKVITEKQREKEQKDKAKIEKVKAKELRKEQAALKKIDKEYITIELDHKTVRLPKKMVFEMQDKKEFNFKEDKKKLQEGEIIVLYLRESGVGEMRYVRPENGMFIIDGKYYHSIGTCNFNIGKNRVPLAVIPEWGFVPLSRSIYSDSLGQSHQEAQSLIIKSIENAEVVKVNQETGKKSKPDGKIIIWILIGGVVALFALNQIFGGA